MTVRGFRDSIRTFTPKWLSNRRDQNIGYKLLYAVTVSLDVLMQGVSEGVQAPWPGRGTPTALPLIGRNRGIVRGEGESEASYSARLIPWLDDWANAGSSAIIAKQIHNYLGNKPRVRIVDRSGNWVTVNADGTVTYATAAWDWDSISNPERANFWSDLWIIIYPTEWAITGTMLASLVSIWGTYNGVGLGHAVPREAYATIPSIVAQWKGAHTFIRSIIWSYDDALFDPANMAHPGNPDGKWGQVSMVDARNIERATRNGNCRYWEPANG